MFKIRTEPVLKGTQPYNWLVDSIYQCTWYCFYRALECGYSAPCYWDRETRTGSYTNAKEWLKNYREPWVVKGVDYQPVAGDIAVYDGTYGHVQFLETDVMYSEYRNGIETSFKNGKFGDYGGTLLGFLHYPQELVRPVPRNTSVDQIQTTDISLRIRTKPSLSGDVVGYVQLGYYNVYDKKENDGYTWYKLAKDRWCANVSTIYLPSDETDVIKEIERVFIDMKSSIEQKDEIINDRNKRLTDIKELANYE